MPVADTEVLFALRPTDRKHHAVIKLLRTLPNVVVPDTALLEFELVLRGKGLPDGDVMKALELIKRILGQLGISQVKTLDIDLLIQHNKIMMDYGLSFFDSLIAASALSLDKVVISDDRDFDKVPGLKRIAIR
ncbi:MAG: hypothetical protein DRO65_03605 [Candidatus Altiarchaeales archaeon]|nr:MAG: hypothetical protein DRO65_03605 [Candidatus Altiarchaeales archaeon]